MAKKQNKKTIVDEQNGQKRKFFPESTGSILLDILRSILMLIRAVLKLVLRLLICIIYFAVGFGLYYLPPLFPQFGIPQIDLFDCGLPSIIYLCIGVGLFVVCIGSACKKKAEVKNKGKREKYMSSFAAEAAEGATSAATVLQGVDVNGDGVADFVAAVPTDGSPSVATVIPTVQTQSVPVTPPPPVVAPFPPQPTLSSCAGAPVQPIAGDWSSIVPSAQGAPLKSGYSRENPKIFVEEYSDCYKCFTVSDDGKIFRLKEIITKP